MIIILGVLVMLSIVGVSLLLTYQYQPIHNKKMDAKDMFRIVEETIIYPNKTITKFHIEKYVNEKWSRKYYSAVQGSILAGEVWHPYGYREVNEEYSRDMCLKLMTKKLHEYIDENSNPEIKTEVIQ